MTSLRNVRIAVAMAVLQAVYQPLAASAATHVAPTPAATDVAPKYDGAAVVAGLFFGAGPVAELFPELYGNPSAALSVEDRDVLLARITTDHPGFLDKFSSAMQSGDHVLIAENLQYSGRVVSESTGVAFADGNTGPQYSNNEGKCLFINIAVVANIAIFVQVITEVMWWVNEPDPGDSIDDDGGLDFARLLSHSQLRYDYVVSLIAERLAIA